MRLWRLPLNLPCNCHAQRILAVSGRRRDPRANLPICDPHHHLWDHPQNRYLLDELILDTASGHNVVSTVFMECGSMYRAHGLESLRPIGETEFVNGIAAMSASDQYGPSRLCAAIVGYADLTLGTAVGDVLDKHMTVSERFREFAMRPDGTPAMKSAIHTRIHRSICIWTGRFRKASRSSPNGD